MITYIANTVVDTFSFSRKHTHTHAHTHSKTSNLLKLIHTHEMPYACIHRMAFPLVEKAMESADQGLRLEAESCKDEYRERVAKEKEWRKKHKYRNTLD